MVPLFKSVISLTSFRICKCCVGTMFKKKKNRIENVLIDTLPTGRLRLRHEVELAGQARFIFLLSLQNLVIQWGITRGNYSADEKYNATEK